MKTNELILEIERVLDQLEKAWDMCSPGLLKMGSGSCNITKAMPY